MEIDSKLANRIKAELRLPNFNGKRTHAEMNTTGGFHHCVIMGEFDNELARQVYYQPERWSFSYAMTLNNYESVLAMCKLVDVFIRSHQERDARLMEFAELCEAGKDLESSMLAVSSL